MREKEEQKVNRGHYIRDGHRGSGRFFKIHRGSGAAAVDFLKIHRGSGSIFFEDIEKVHEFDRILVFTSETS
jgi:hypothetical protein